MVSSFISMLKTQEGRAFYNRIMIEAQWARAELKRLTKINIMQKPIWAKQDGDIDYECYDAGDYLIIEIFTETNGRRTTIKVIEENGSNDLLWKKYNRIMDANQQERLLWELTMMNDEQWERYMLGY
nr:hypothetical protein [Mute swan associated circo-like virus]